MIVWQGFSQSTSADKVCFKSIEARRILNDLYKGELCDSLLKINSNKVAILTQQVSNQKEIILAREGQITAVNNLFELAKEQHATELEIKQSQIKRLKKQKITAYFGSGLLLSLLVLTNI